MKAQSWLDGVLVAVSLAASLVVGEMAARLVLKPVDYLAVTTESDPILGHRIPPRRSGHDSWGFRNKAVPASASVVAIGDSHTYGNAAKMGESWPAVLGRRLSTDVYNLGMGGYGPDQYAYLFESKALPLKPSLVVLGLYTGDDLDNAYCITYNLDYWASLRDRSITNPEPCLWELEVGESFGKRARHWLATHSVLYQVVVHGPVLGWLRSRVQRATVSDNRVAVLSYGEKGIKEAFVPAPMIRGVDLTRKSTTEGLRITLELIARMSAACRQRSIRFVVAIIPAKEGVFAERLLRGIGSPLDAALARVAVGDENVRGILAEHLTRAGIEYVDTTEDLRQAAVGDKLYAASTNDMHPNARGYTVIADRLARYLGNR